MALDTLVVMERDGFTFRDGGGVVLVRPRNRVTPRQAEVIRDGKALILDVLRWRRLDAATDEQVARQSDAGLFDGNTGVPR